MNKASEDKRKSEIVKHNPSVIVVEMPRQIGYPVWCGNEACEEYNRKQDEEYHKRMNPCEQCRFKKSFCHGEDIHCVTYKNWSQQNQSSTVTRDIK